MFFNPTHSRLLNSSQYIFSKKFQKSLDKIDFIMYHYIRKINKTKAQRCGKVFKMRKFSSLNASMIVMNKRSLKPVMQMDGMTSMMMLWCFDNLKKSQIALVVDNELKKQLGVIEKNSNGIPKQYTIQEYPIEFNVEGYES